MKALSWYGGKLNEIDEMEHEVKKGKTTGQGQIAPHNQVTALGALCPPPAKGAHEVGFSKDCPRRQKSASHRLFVDMYLQCYRSPVISSQARIFSLVS